MHLDLFAPQPQQNLLPYDGDVQDYGLVLNCTDASAYLDYFLQHLPWRPDQVKLHGRQIQTARQMVWYADQACNYAYSGVTRQALPWDSRLLQLKQQIERETGEQFNSCLANLYQDGTQGMGWHRDDDMGLAPTTSIASLSLGATRKFVFRHLHTHEKVEIQLQHGQLILMKGVTQKYWQHALMKSARVMQPRINLTFRQFQF